MKRNVLVSLSLGIACCTTHAPTATERSCEPAAGSRTHPRAAEFDAELSDIVTRLRLPGAILAVHDATGLYVGAAGMADLDHAIPMQPCHRTRIASVTKSFVAVVVMRLAERGVLSIKDRARDWLTQSMLDGVPNAQTVRIRDLLANRSGIPDYVDTGFVLEALNQPNRFWTATEALDRIRGRNPAFAAGERFAYSNTNWILLEAIVEEATGRSFAEVLESEVLVPLALTRTSYRRDAPPSEGIVRGYFDVFGNGAVVDTTDNLAVGTVTADGGIVTDAIGVLRLYDALLGERTLLDQQSLGAMQTWSDTSLDPEWVTGPFSGYGLGLIRWEVEGQQGIGHGGDLFGYQAHAYHFEAHGATFVLLVNGSSFTSVGDNLTARVDRARDSLAAIVLRH